MFSKDRSAKSLSNALLEASAWVLFSAGICAFSSALLVDRLTDTTTAVKLDVHGLTQWSGLYWSVSSGVAVTTEDVSNAQSVAMALIADAERTLQGQRARAQQLARRAFPRPQLHAAQAAPAQAAPAQAAPAQAIAVSDALRVEQSTIRAVTTKAQPVAHERPAQVTTQDALPELPVEVAVTTQTGFLEATDAELSALRHVTFRMRVEYEVAVRDGVFPQELDAPPAATPVAPAVKLAQGVSQTKKKRIPLKNQKKSTRVTQTQAPVTIQSVAPTEEKAVRPPQPAQVLVPGVSVATATFTPTTLTDAGPLLQIRPTPSQVFPPQAALTTQDVNSQEEAPIEVTQSAPSAAPETPSPQELDEQERWSAARAQLEQAEARPVQGVRVSPVTTQNTQSLESARWIATTVEQKAPQKAAPKKEKEEATRPTQVDATMHASTKGASDESVEKQQEDSRSHGWVKPDPVRTSVWTGVEAFNWKKQIDIATRRFAEDRGARVDHEWRIAESAGFMKTLFHGAKSGDRQLSVPMLSMNSVTLLAARASVKSQKSMGIVFGKIREDQEIEFSGRAEKLALFPGPDGYQTFVWMNTEPGVHLIYPRSGGAIAVPVIEGVASYVDLTDTKKTRFQGWVLDGSEDGARAMRGVTVRVVGQASAVALTGSNGSFAIDGIVTYGTYPLFVETVVSNEFKHRYRVSSDKLNGIELFRFSPHRIESWTHQLEGDVNAASGLMVAAFPRLQAEHAGRQLMPKVLPANRTAALAPETYALGPDDRLIEKAPLVARSPRFVGIQLPEGLNFASLTDDSRTEVWSELIISSPGVVNVVGPY